MSTRTKKFSMDYNNLLEFALISFTSIFGIVNPINGGTIFYSLTTGFSNEKKKEIARRASTVCCCVLIIFSLFGSIIFKFFGISIPAFRIAGGILIFKVAMDMLQARQSRIRTTPEEQESAVHKEDISIVPLAVPMLSGPGAITTVVVLMSKSTTFFEHLIIIFCVVITSFLTYIIFTETYLITRFLKESGTRIMTRFMGLFILANSVQFIINGIKDVLSTMFHFAH